MSWSDSVCSVWQWGKGGLVDQYNTIIRPSCPDCTSLKKELFTVQNQIDRLGASTFTTASLPVTMRPTSFLVRIAGVSGALAIGLGAYGAHSLAGQEKSEERIKAFEVANRYHLVHSVALLALPLARRPGLSGALMVGGISVFCGTCYYHALTGDKQFRQFTPYGGVLLILAWLSLVL